MIGCCESFTQAVIDGYIIGPQVAGIEDGYGNFAEMNVYCMWRIVDILSGQMDVVPVAFCPFCGEEIDWL